MNRSRYYQIVWIYCKEFPNREVPLVLLEDGLPGYVINQWIIYLLDEQITQARLESYIRAICHLYDFALSLFAVSNYIQFDTTNRILIRDFFSAKRFGTDEYCVKKDKRYTWLQYLGLNWKPLSNKHNTLFSYENAINKFDTWQTTYHKSDSINPCEKRFLTAFEAHLDFERRKDFDPLAHLDSARNKTKKAYSESAIPKYEHNRYQRSRIPKTIKKVFPPDLFMKLIATTKNPRDQLLWISMGAGSLRCSEPLHTFFSDIKPCSTKHGSTKVILADPELGYVTWTDEQGREHHTSRADFFRHQYTNSHFQNGHPLRNLQPRTLYGKRNSKLHSGFKGMTFHENNIQEKLFSTYNRPYDEHHIWWLDPIWGKIFWKSYKEYWQNYIEQNYYTKQPNPTGWPWHPWLFICTNKNNYGMPLTMPALRKAWELALKRIGLQNSHLSPHSLRHMYGYFAANILKLDLTTIQTMMHHANINSTRIYSKLTSSTVNGYINQAAMQENRISKEWKKLLPGSE